MGFFLDDNILVEADCGILPGWINRNLDILRQLDCRAAVLDYEVRREMVRMIQPSSTTVKANPRSILNKTGIKSAALYQAHRHQRIAGEPPLKRCRLSDNGNELQGLSNREQFSKAPQAQPGSDSLSEISTTPSTPSAVSPTLVPQCNMLLSERFLSLRPSSLCGDSSPSSFVSSSPLTPTDQPPTDSPIQQHERPTSENSSAKLPETVADRCCALQHTTPESSIKLDFDLQSLDPSPELSVIRYLLGRKRALLVQKLSLLRHGCGYVQREHKKLLERQTAARHQIAAEPTCSVSKRLRNSTSSIVTASSYRQATEGPTTRYKQQQQQFNHDNVSQPLDKSENEKTTRTSRTSSIHSTGSTSGTSSLVSENKVVSRRSRKTTGATQTAVSSPEPHAIGSQLPFKVDFSVKSEQTPGQSSRLTIAHRSHPPTHAALTSLEQASSVPPVACVGGQPTLPKQNWSKASDNSGNHLNENHRVNCSQSGRDKLSHIAYEPLNPSVAISAKQTTVMKDSIHSTTPNIPKLLSPDNPYLAFQRFEIGQRPATQFNQDPTSLFSSYSSQKPHAAIQQAFSMYHPTVQQGAESNPGVAFLSPGIVSGQKSSTATSPTILPTNQHANKQIRLSHPPLPSHNQSVTSTSVTNSLFDSSDQKPPDESSSSHSLNDSHTCPIKSSPTNDRDVTAPCMGTSEALPQTVSDICSPLNHSDTSSSQLYQHVVPTFVRIGARPIDNGQPVANSERNSSTMKGVSITPGSVPPVRSCAVVCSISSSIPLCNSSNSTTQKQKTKKGEKMVAPVPSISSVQKPCERVIESTTTAESDWSGKCPVCGQGESAYEGMVACDNCNEWFHFICVGYKQKIVESVPVLPPTQKTKKSKKKQIEIQFAMEDDDNWYCQKCINSGNVSKEELSKMKR